MDVSSHLGFSPSLFVSFKGETTKTASCLLFTVALRLRRLIRVIRGNGGTDHQTTRSSAASSGGRALAVGLELVK